MLHDRLLTTTIGAYPKPGCTPIGDWFPDPDDTDAGAKGEGLLKRWERAGYQERLARAGEAAEEAFVKAIEEVVRDQVDAGIDIPTDGEVRRENYIFYQCRNLNGIDFDHLTEKVARDGAFTARVPTITGEVTPRDLVLARDWRIAKRVTDRPVKITLPGPMTIADSMANEFYPDPRALGRALAEALNAEVDALETATRTHGGYVVRFVSEDAARTWDAYGAGRKDDYLASSNARPGWLAAFPPLLRAAFPRATGGGRARQEPAVDTYSGCT